MSVKATWIWGTWKIACLIFTVFRGLIRVSNIPSEIIPSIVMKSNRIFSESKQIDQLFDFFVCCCRSWILTFSWVPFHQPSRNIVSPGRYLLPLNEFARFCPICVRKYPFFVNTCCIIPISFKRNNFNWKA